MYVTVFSQFDNNEQINQIFLKKILISKNPFLPGRMSVMQNFQAAASTWSAAWGKQSRTALQIFVKPYQPPGTTHNPLLCPQRHCICNPLLLFIRQRCGAAARGKALTAFWKWPCSWVAAAVAGRSTVSLARPLEIKGSTSAHILPLNFNQGF